MDLDCDSPFSPGSASDLSDMFEPPTSSPPPSSLPKISLPISSSAKQSKSFKKKPSDSRAWQSIIGESDKGGKLARKLANSGKAFNNKNYGWYYGNVSFFWLREACQKKAEIGSLSQSLLSPPSPLLIGT